MTTIIATRGLVAGDSSLDSGNGSVPVQKIVRIRNSLWGVAGSYADALKFLRWVKSNFRRSLRPEFPVDSESDKFEFDALQVTPSGIVLWDQDLEPMQIGTQYHALGSGGGYALGALDCYRDLFFGAEGAPKETDVSHALRVAAARDANTRAPFHYITLSGESWQEPTTESR